MSESHGLMGNEPLHGWPGPDMFRHGPQGSQFGYEAPVPPGMPPWMLQHGPPMAPMHGHMRDPMMPDIMSSGLGGGPQKIWIPHKQGLTEEESRSMLGVGSGASQEEIRKKYLKLVRQHHPDTKRNLAAGGSDSTIKNINEAYETLSPRALARGTSNGITPLFTRNFDEIIA